MTDTPITDADLAELERLQSEAKLPQLMPWYEPPTGSNDWADKAAIHGLPLTGVDRMIVFWRRHAEYLAAAHNSLPNIIARLEAAEGKRQWQPIETAPKDGTRILVFDEQPLVAHFSQRQRDWVTDAGDGVMPTAWQPLPEPPEARELREAIGG